VDTNTVHIIDCTLREGAQAPGVLFSPEQSEEIAALLVASGVNMIECGHAAASEEEKRRIKRTLVSAGDTPVLVHARANRRDIDAVAETGAGWCGIFLAFNTYARRTKVVGASLSRLLSMTADSVAYAVRSGLRVRFTVEDATRTPDSVLVRAYEAAISAGADRICFADTVGLLEPRQVAVAVGRLRERFRAVDLELHLHDDRGLSMANALAGIDAGANWVSCSVNGIGERSGITDLIVLLANMHQRGSRALRRTDALQRASELVAAFARMPVSSLSPVTGSNAFTHTAQLHRRAVAIDPMAYSWIDPRKLGRETSTASSNQKTQKTLSDLVVEPEIRSATELPHHRHGPGRRFLLVDGTKVSDCRQYCIVRAVRPGDDIGRGHVDEHRHNVDSCFFFLGAGEDLDGLEVEVAVGDEVRRLNSPVSVFIPAGTRHSYRVIAGAGLYINHVLAGSYHESLLE